MQSFQLFDAFRLVVTTVLGGSALPSQGGALQARHRSFVPGRPSANVRCLAHDMADHVIYIHSMIDRWTGRVLCTRPIRPRRMTMTMDLFPQAMMLWEVLLWCRLGAFRRGRSLFVVCFVLPLCG